MTTEELFAFSNMVCESTFRPRVPYTPNPIMIDGRLRQASTGNMRYNATVCTQTGADEITLQIDESIAPYVVYTNEPWLSPKWNGKKNPNEKWFEMATKLFIEELSRQLGGVAELIDGG